MKAVINTNQRLLTFYPPINNVSQEDFRLYKIGNPVRFRLDQGSAPLFSRISTKTSILSRTTAAILCFEGEYGARSQQDCWPYYVTFWRTPVDTPRSHP